MRFDRLRRRSHPSPSVPTPPSDHHAQPDFYSTSSADPGPPPPNPAPVTRRAFIRALEARMEQMERVPTRSFFHSYAGEFDMLQGEDRRAIRKEHEFETSIKAENANRNRYVNILSNELTRVKLEDLAPGESDYINANHVNGHLDHSGYIATQAPLPVTMSHFWQMVYESVSPVIIMLTRESEDHCAMVKSEKYWPAIGENILFHNYLVYGVDQNYTIPGVIERRFQVARVVDSRKKRAKDLVDADSLIPTTAEGSAVWQTPARGRANTNCDVSDCEDDEELLRHLEAIGTVLEVVQLQYLNWPDQEVPESPKKLLDLCARVDVLSEAHYLRSGICAPPIVHCSAGIGRTGTFIAVDKTLRWLWDAFAYPSGANRQPVCVEDIRELVREIKHDRSRMVQTPEQYRFIYEAVLAGLKRWEMGQPIFQERPAGRAERMTAYASGQRQQRRGAAMNGPTARLRAEPNGW